MADSCYSLALTFNCGGQFAESVWHYHFDDSGYVSTASAASHLATTWLTANKAALVACLPSGVTLLSVKARKVSAVGGFEAIVFVTSGGAGTRAGGLMASGVNPIAVMLPVANGKLRGKWFVPGISIDDMTDGVTNASFRASIDTQLGTLKGLLTLTGGGTPTATLSIYSRATNSWQAVEFFYCSSTVGRQRRRQRPT